MRSKKLTKLGCFRSIAVEATTLTYLFWSQIQWNLAEIAHGERRAFYSEYFLLFALLAFGVKGWLRTWTEMSVSAKAFFASWFILGLASSLFQGTFGLWSLFALIYVVRVMPLGAAFSYLPEAKRGGFRDFFLVGSLFIQILSLAVVFIQSIFRAVDSMPWDYDAAFGLMRDANQAGLGFALAVLVLYDLRSREVPARFAIDKWTRGPAFYALVCAFLLGTTLTYSNTSTFWLAPALIMLELLLKPTHRRTAILRSALLTLMLASFYILQDVSPLIHKQGFTLGAFRKYFGSTITTNSGWLYEGQLSGKSEDSGRVVRIQASLDFWNQRRKSPILGLGPGSIKSIEVNKFISLSKESRLVGPYHHDFLEFARTRFNIENVMLFSYDLIAWLLGWGPLAVILFGAIFFQKFLDHLYKRRVFESGVLAFAIFQIPVQNYTFEYLLGPAVVLALCTSTGQARES